MHHHKLHRRHRHHNQMSQKQKTIRGVIALIAALAAVFAVVALVDFIQRKKNSTDTAQAAITQDGAKSKRLGELNDPRWSDENTLCIDDQLYGFDHRIETYLFIGTDHSGNPDGEGKEYHGGMADFLLLMVIDHTDGKYGYLQIDRNTITEVSMLDDEGLIAGYPLEQICTAHWYGTDKTQSAENTVDVVCEFLGELDHIDGYYVLDMDEIGTLNSFMGGVTVTIDEDMTMVDPAFVNGTTITLSDSQAQAFVRARKALDNEENGARMRRQRIFMDAFFKQAISEVKSHPNFANRLWDALKNAATTDMSGSSFSRIAETFRADESSGILKFEGNTTLGTILGDGVEHEEFYPSTESMVEILTELFSLQPLEDEDLEDADAEEEYDDSDDIDADSAKYADDTDESDEEDTAGDDTDDLGEDETDEDDTDDLAEDEEIDE